MKLEVPRNLKCHTSLVDGDSRYDTWPVAVVTIQSVNRSRLGALIPGTLGAGSLQPAFASDGLIEYQ